VKQQNNPSARTAPASFLRHATDVASFYGFRPAREIERMAANRLVKRVGAHTFETVSHVSATRVAMRPGEPALAYYASPYPTHIPKNFLPRESGEFGLQVIGSGESLGEVVLLKTLSAIITEWGAAIERVRINATGDKDSQQRFLRELSVYTRKHMQSFDEPARADIAANPLSAYICPNDNVKQLLSEGPRSVNFLSERSRIHFRSVLEHLENLGLPYELDDLLLGDERDPHISFAIDLEGADATIMAVMGGRYDDFIKKHSGRKEGVGVAASIFFRKRGAARSSFTAPLKASAPKIYFVQLGTRAKLQGLFVVDMLREAHIPVSQSFDTSHLSPQLVAARELGVPYMLIMGQREAIDGTIIVRSTQNSSQTIIQLAALPRFLKTLH
jgi:histidyl-tRNA synthetase